MANFDMDRARFTDPTLTGAPWPRVKVRTATFDRSAAALVLRLEAQHETSVTVVNLKQGTRAVLLIDGEYAETIDVKTDKSAAADRGAVSFRVPAGDHAYVLGVV